MDVQEFLTTFPLLKVHMIRKVQFSALFFFFSLKRGLNRKCCSLQINPYSCLSSKLRLAESWTCSKPIRKTYEFVRVSWTWLNSHTLRYPVKPWSRNNWSWLLEKLPGELKRGMGARAVGYWLHRCPWGACGR